MSHSPDPSQNRKAVLEFKLQNLSESVSLMIKGYDDSIRRLESLLTISGVMLAIMMSALSQDYPRQVWLLFAIATISLAISSLISIIGLFTVRSIQSIIDTEDMIFSGEQDYL